MHCQGKSLEHEGKGEEVILDVFCRSEKLLESTRDV